MQATPIRNRNFTSLHARHQSRTASATRPQSFENIAPVTRHEPPKSEPELASSPPCFPVSLMQNSKPRRFPLLARQKRSPISSLPDKLLLEIIIRIPSPQTYLALSAVSKRFNMVMSAPYTEACFAKQWLETNLRSSDTPSIIEYIVRYVCYHRLAPFRCKDVSSVYPPHCMIPDKCRKPNDIMTFIDTHRGRITPYARRGGPNALGFRWKESGVPVADLGTLVWGYTNLTPTWFIEFYRRLRNRVPLFESSAGTQSQPSMANLSFGMEEVVLASYLLKGWKDSVKRLEEDPFGIYGSMFLSRYGDELKTGKIFFDLDWFRSRDRKEHEECRCVC
ncbi:hypothetical protein BJ508DRAFT_327545 [Ascobolus immersus RN42]|uniref:F-box domain-containing protein n=1 Tax=Ascobolus immersus RN42 TaxID=1160509 RepID=A0A3N4I455_ASCIM|nr:hypothetical protein BJ508DRAFT_327545 [Ascobolus immersus RN42]